MEKVIHTVLDLGLEKPVKILQITDVHLTETDPRDPVAQQEHMDKRRTVFRKESGYVPFTPNEYFEEALAMAEELGALPVVTGDVMDVNCIGNREEFARIVAGKDMMFTPGSHEFAAFCRAPVEGHEERYAKTRPEVEAAFPQFKFTFDSRTVGGVNLITVDNSRDFFPAEVLEGLKAEAEKGLPMVLFMHDPLVDHGLLRIREPHPFTLQPKEVYEASDEVLKFIDTCPLIKATFAGHWHGETERKTDGGVPVYVTPGLFKGICRLIEIK